MLSGLNKAFRLLEPKSGVQVFPAPAQEALAAKTDLSIYQRCTSVRHRLANDPTFARFLSFVAETSTADLSDPVNHLWDCFSLGISLCYLYNCAVLTAPVSPGLAPITVGADLSILRAANDSERRQKHAVMLFCMEVSKLNPTWDNLIVTDLINNRVSLDGFLKFLYIVDAILHMLPKDIFGDTPTTSSLNFSKSRVTQEPQVSANWDHLLTTERNYVRDLENLHAYSTILKDNHLSSISDRLFPGLNQLLNFQRWFCIHLEVTATLPVEIQRLGLLFVENETGFAGVYEPYCANISSAADLILTEEDSLMPFNKFIDVRLELPALILKPSHRIYSYPIVLESLLSINFASTPEMHLELEEGLNAMTRVCQAVNLRQRRMATQTMVDNLINRVKDWKGLDTTTFGDLILVDVLNVAGAVYQHESHVFLFQNILLCLSDVAYSQVEVSSRMKRNGAIRRKTLSEAVNTPRKDVDNAKAELVLEYYVLFSDIIFASSSIEPDTSEYMLVISWRKADIFTPEQLCLYFRNEAQLKEWKTHSNQLIDEVGGYTSHSDRGSEDTASIAISSASSEQSRLPLVHVERVDEIKPTLRPKALSVRSQNTLGSTDDHIIGYYFNGLLSPGHSGRDAFSIGSGQGSSEYDTTSILLAYQQSGSPSSPLSRQSSPISPEAASSEGQGVTVGTSAFPTSPIASEMIAQFYKDIKFMRTVVRLEGTPEAVTLQRGDNAAQTLDLLQNVLDRVQIGLTLVFLDDDQFLDASTLRHQFRRILFKLATDADVLPPSLFIAGLHVPRIDRAVCLGGFADIYLGSYRGEAVAVKRLRINDEHLSTNKALWKEALIWRQLDHRFVLKFVGVDQETFHPHTCMVSPWLPHGNVMSYMKREGPQYVEVGRILNEVAQGIEYLHSQGVVHGDLRGSNILIDGGHHPRLADFGLGSLSDATVGSQTAKGHGSLRYMAPELLRPSPLFQRTPPTDVYSFACVCIELYTCAKPYANIPIDMQVLYHIISTPGWRPSRPSSGECPGAPLPESTWEIIQHCWVDEPEKRLTMPEVVQRLSVF